MCSSINSSVGDAGVNEDYTSISDNYTSDNKPVAKILIEGGLSLSDSQVKYLNSIFESKKGKNIELCIYVK